jgi:CubicO group peptidase (beta-lactamase class C family)
LGCHPYGIGKDRAQWTEFGSSLCFTPREAEVAGLKVDVDPAEVGFDADRLGRIDRFLTPYVDQGRLPNYLLVLARHGKIAHVSSYGYRDVDSKAPVETDTLFRIFSMTKPITSVAAMMLYERGALDLNDPVATYIPSMGEARVYTGGSELRAMTVPQTEPMRVWHLLTHTSGLTYGFHRSHAVDGMYRIAGYEWGRPPGTDLAKACDDWAGLPLLFQPGTEWNYSVSTDVLGRVVEVASGKALDEFFDEEIFGPLGMGDTGFWVDESDVDRLATLYLAAPGGKMAPGGDMGRPVLKRPSFLSGGGGLVSCAHDYHRFTQMLLRGGELDGVRLLSPRTVRYMGRNHLPGGQDLETFGRPLFAEVPFRGVGFGLGFAVVLDAAAGKSMSAEGELSWGGAASTAFWIDPADGVTALFFTQLLPSSATQVRTYLRHLVQQALVD